MHNHDEDKQSQWTMWAMVLCCALPLLLILIFFGVGGKASGSSMGVIWGGIVVMAALHLFMMFVMGKSHKHSDEEHETADGEDKSKGAKDNSAHSGHGCCH